MPKVKAQDEVQKKVSAPLSLERNKAMPDKMSNPQRLALMPMREPFSEEGDNGRSGIAKRAGTMRRIQRTVGNTVAVRIAASPAPSSLPPIKHLIQSKLTIGQPEDMYEREAEAASSRISAGRPVDHVSRMTSGDFSLKMNRQPEEEEDENAQRQEHEESSPEKKTDVDTAEKAISRSCAGAPLCPMMRQRMEESFGADFSDVRVHTGEAAQEATQALNARAFTSGKHIYLARSESANDSGLLGHELAHSIQQGAAPFEDGNVQRRHPRKAHIMPKTRAPVAPSTQTIQPSYGVDAVQRIQHPAASRQSRIAVATSIHSFRPTYPNTRGGQLTQRLRRQLRNRRQSVAAVVGVVGEGSRTFGARPTAGEERAGVSLGMPATATGTATQRAVVVGNGDYDQTGTMGNTVEPLRDLSVAVTEARAIASTLQGRGYNVNHQDNKTATEIGVLLQSGIAGLGAGDELVFYYHGHGTIEGLIGRDGSVFTPSQMVALRSMARIAQVNLTLALEGCHTGVFADAIRGAELRDTLASMRARVGATSGVVRYARQLLLPVLDNAIAIQVQKDLFNTRAQAWWARRFQIEQQMASSSYTATLMNIWRTHYDTLQGIWNNLVTVVTALLSTLRTNAIAAGLNVELSQQIVPLSGPFNQNGEQAIQAGLDDLDIILNRVLRETDARLR